MRPLVKQIISSLSVTLVGYAGGMVLAYPGILLTQLKLQNPELSLTTSEASWFVSISQLVSIPGSILGGIFMESFGPRRLILISLLPLALTWAFIDYSVYSPTILIFIRAVQGFINSFLSTASYVYTCEIADKKRRGILGGLADTSFSLGFLVTYLIGGVVKWCYMGYIIIAITIIPSFIGVYFVPESPVWLVRHGKFLNAKQELKKIRHVEEIEHELFAYEEKAREETNMSCFERAKLLLKSRNYFAVLTSALLLALKEATGQFAIVLFIFQIFQKANPTLSTYWCSVIVGFTRLIANLLSCVLLTKISRRALIIIPSYIAALSLCVLGIYFYKESWYNSSDLTYLPLALLTVFVICYGMGIGPTSWILATEILPSAVRNIGSGIGQAGFNLAQWLVAGSFPEIENSVGIFACFWIYSAGAFVIATFVLICLPETKSKTLTEIEDYWIQLEERVIRFKKRICRQ